MTVATSLPAPKMTASPGTFAVALPPESALDQLGDWWIASQDVIQLNNPNWPLVRPAMLAAKRDIAIAIAAHPTMLAPANVAALPSWITVLLGIAVQYLPAPFPGIIQAILAIINGLTPTPKPTPTPAPLPTPGAARP